MGVRLCRGARLAGRGAQLPVWPHRGAQPSVRRVCFESGTLWRATKELREWQRSHACRGATRCSCSPRDARTRVQTATCAGQPVDPGYGLTRCAARCGPARHPQRLQRPALHRAARLRCHNEPRRLLGRVLSKGVSWLPLLMIRASMHECLVRGLAQRSACLACTVQRAVATQGPADHCTRRLCMRSPGPQPLPRGRRQRRRLLAGRAQAYKVPRRGRHRAAHTTTVRRTRNTTC